MIQATINDLFRRTKQDWLEEARDTAEKLLATRRTVTIEDVLEVCPRPKYLHRNVTGSVFQDKRFKPEGFIQSRRTVSHGRIVRTWTLKDQYMTADDVHQLVVEDIVNNLAVVE